MSKNHDQRKALGKGLSALLPSRSAPRPEPEAPSTPVQPAPPPSIQQLPIDAIQPNPVQPRTIFMGDRLNELAQSIRANGIIQPLIVRRTAGDSFQLVAGERRWRAARLAGLEQVPVFIQDFADDRLLEVALIENIQREDLNPIEVAQALDRLAKDHSLSHEEIGTRTGKDRTTVTNLIRLLRLPSDIQLLVAEHRLSMGHARAILGLPTEDLQKEVAQRAAAESLSVRQVERMIQGMTSKREVTAPTERSKEPAFDPNVAAATRELEAALGTRVRIVAQGSSRGRIEIEYFSGDELDRIYNLIVTGKN